MAMNASLYPVLKAAILAETDPAFVAARTLGQTPLMTAFLNADSTFVVWRKVLTKEAMRVAAVQGSAEMDNLEAGKRDALYWLIGDTVNPSDPQIRTAFQDLTANRTGGFVATALRTAMIAAAKRFATRVEALYATGTGTTGTPGDLVYIGPLTDADVSNALAS